MLSEPNVRRTLRLHYVRDVCHKTLAHRVPHPSRTPGPRQHILRLSRRRWLLGPSLPFGLAVGCLLHFWRASNGLLCSAHPFCAMLGRCFMPGLRASERPSALCPIDLETFPFWGQPIIRVWLVVHTVPAVCAGVTTPQCTFSYLAHSRFPECFCHPVWQLHSLLPAFDPRLPVARRGKGLSPVHQRGRGCCDTACAVSFTCMDMQLRKSSDFRRPAPILSDSFGRTGRTHRVRRTSAGVPPHFQETGPVADSASHAAAFSAESPSLHPKRA